MEEATPLVAPSAAAVRRRRLRRVGGLALAACAGGLALAQHSTSAPPAPALAVDDASAASTCVVHVATGDEFVGVSAVTWPTKTAYASARGYRAVPYVFDSAADLPQCCDGVDSYACSLAHVQMKYCALLDALETGGAGSSDAGAAADAAGGAACDRVFLTDSDALLAPDAVDVGALLSVDGAAADLVLSAGAADVTFPVDGAATLYEDFNSGAMIWTAAAAGLARQVVAFDNSNFKGAGACACDTRNDGCGDQWAFAGVVDARGFGGLRAVAYAHPAKLQRLFYHVDASTSAYLDEYVAAGFPLAMVKATGEKMVEWPPASTDESFVMACAGADPRGCVETLHATFYGDAATPLTELADAGTVKGAYDEKFAADVLDAAYGADIDCAVFDDDAWYPGAAYGSCFTLDINTQCAEHVWPGAPRYLPAYAAACAQACPTEEAYASAPDGFVPSAYSDLCAWQGVANMEATCDGTFAPTAPAAGDSKDLFPRVVGAEADYMAETRGGCGAHSFCLTCYDDDGSLNANCDRVLRH